MMSIMLELLQKRPEEERTLLSLIVNKFGDKEKKVATFASISLKRLLRTHPNMTCIILQQLGQFTSQSGIPAHSVFLIVKLINEITLIPPTIVSLLD